MTMSFDFFATGFHTRIAVARLPLRQLGFLVIIIMITVMMIIIIIIIFVVAVRCKNYSLLY